MKQNQQTNKEKESKKTEILKKIEDRKNKVKNRTTISKW